MANELSSSFISQITILVFDLAYGFSSTAFLRRDAPQGGIDGDQNKMGFGRLVPFLLLLLPGLTVGEYISVSCSPRPCYDVG